MVFAIQSTLTTNTKLMNLYFAEDLWMAKAINITFRSKDTHYYCKVFNSSRNKKQILRTKFWAKNLPISIVAEATNKDFTVYACKNKNRLKFFTKFWPNFTK